MTCPHCGHLNSAGSVFCEQCGTRLASPVAPACERCGGANQPHMRFCVHCGNALAPVGAAPVGVAPVGAAPVSAHSGAVAPTPFGQPAGSPAVASASTRTAPPPALEPAPYPVAAAPSAVEAPASPVVSGPVCGRCRGVGDAGAGVCKFCGTRYADAARPDPRSTVHGPPQTGERASTASAHATEVRLVAILKDGSDGMVHAVQVPATDLGRTEGDLRFPDDPYLSARHARLRESGGRWFLRDLDSVNGVFLRIREPVELRAGDVLLLGQQVLRFELLEDAEVPLGPASVQGVMVFGTPEAPRYGRLVQYTTEGVGRDVHYLYRDETVLGRETGDIVFTDDPFLSRRHASITVERSTKRVVLRDLGSSNGTSVRLRAEQELRHDDQFRVGRHLFRFDGGAQR